MKKLIIGGLFGGVFGYALNTETGKKLVTWVREKTQDQINNLVNKVNEVTSKKTSEEETIAE